MKRSTLVRAAVVCVGLGLAAPLLAAQLPAADVANQTAPSEASPSVVKPAETCLNDLRAFDSKMEKDGYWVAGAGAGLGYAAGGLGGSYGYPMNNYPLTAASGYPNARPGYELRTLLASANILARHGQQQPCEDVLGATRGLYKTYFSDLQSAGLPTVDMPGWRQQQIAAARPVASKNAPFRSDELIGASALNLQNETLGSVDDLVISPQTGKIAYLVIARGGFFGIDEKHVPIPWEDFKATPNVTLLVLDTPKAAMDGAPQVNSGQFGAHGQFDAESQKVDAYWKAHLAEKAGN
jgi:sporulation protein YlmC with PRC-barrel domain